MTAAYKSALAAAPPEMRQKIRDGQREWIRSMVASCRPGDPAFPTAFTNCLFAYEKNRTTSLRHMAQRIGGVNFVWQSVNLSAHAGAPGLDHDDSGTLSTSWPKAMVDTPAWRAWNEAIEAAALKDAAIEQGPPPASWKEALSAGTDIDVSVTIELVGEHLVTADIYSYWDGHGAAHGNINEIEFNWLPKEQRELRPDDVFRRGTPWAETIESKCDADLRQQLGDEYDNNPPPNTIPDALKEIVLNPQNWRLDSDGLNVVFRQYAIACYACTPRPVSIPWTDLKPILNSAFEFHP
jgi:hypothetical protein